MSKWTRHTVELIGLCVILIGVAIFCNDGGENYLKSGSTPAKHTAHRVTRTLPAPTLYLHGLQGSAKSTNHLVTVGSQTDGQRAMKINVKRNGRVTYRGHISRGMRHPLVQVNFIDNVAPVRVQSRWLHTVLLHLGRYEHCRNYNVVAHSAGAVTAFVTASRDNQQRHVPKLRKFVSLAGPYDGVIGINDRSNANSVNRQGRPRFMRSANRWYPAYRQLVTLGHRFPRNVKILNVYGCISPRLNSDQYVSTASARSLRYLVRHRARDYQEIRIRGRYAEHSRLHHNSVVDRVIDRFIFTE